VSFSIDCDDDNGDENDDQALYLEAQFFKPKSGPIEFLNVVSTARHCLWGVSCVRAPLPGPQQG